VRACSLRRLLVVQCASSVAVQLFAVYVSDGSNRASTTAAVFPLLAMAFLTTLYLVTINRVTRRFEKTRELASLATRRLAWQLSQSLLSHTVVSLLGTQAIGETARSLHVSEFGGVCFVSSLCTWRALTLRTRFDVDLPLQVC